MKKPVRITIKACFLILLTGMFIASCTSDKAKEIEFSSHWKDQNDRYWIGPEYWANRIQDWQIKDGRLECVEGSRSLRTLHLLTRCLGGGAGTLQMSVETGLISSDNEPGPNSINGFLIAAGNLDLHYKARAQIHNCYGNNAGYLAGIRGDGQLVIIDNHDSLKVLPVITKMEGQVSLREGKVVKLAISLEPGVDGYSLTLSSIDEHGEILASIRADHLPADRLSGNIALFSHYGADENNHSFWFRNWQASGSKLEAHDERAWGPVLSVLYTVSRNTLKLTAQFPSLGESDNMSAFLEVRESGSRSWTRIAESRIIEPGWTAPFRVEGWNDALDHEFRIRYDLLDGSGKKERSYYNGMIPKNPDSREEFVIAAFTGNYNGKSIQDWRAGTQFYDFSHNTMWFPHEDMDRNVSLHHPDLLVYTGDQVYESSFVAADKSGNYSSYLDYLNKWLLFCWAHGDLTRNLPTVCITDDHDVYQINYWGEGGKKARDLPEADSWEEMITKLPDEYQNMTQAYRHDGGGYEMPADWVNMVQRSQCSHLPDPWDPAPVQQGIEVYYSDILYGGIGFAILEDRKFKSAPRPMLPEANVRNGFPLNSAYDVKDADRPDAVLLGERQLEFIETWASDWKGTDMKVALSATIFACANSIPSGEDGLKLDRLKNYPRGLEPSGYSPSKDFDTNGWPQSGRNSALEELRKGFVFMIAGDQHLGTIVHHGVDEWDDAGYSFCVPAIGNIAPRRWFTKDTGINHVDGMPGYTGNHMDAFGNRMNVWAASNPYTSGREPAGLYDRATGYGIIRLNKKSQEITMECWPRFEIPNDPKAEQYEGWPRTIQMADNYGRKAVAYLPTFRISGLQKPPVVRVIEDASGETVYTYRAKTNAIRPKVFKQGEYTVWIGEPGTGKMKKIVGVRSVAEDQESDITLDFGQ